MLIKILYQVQEKYEKKHPASEWRYELRVRYLPKKMSDLWEQDKVTFNYYYDQVGVILLPVLFDYNLNCKGSE